jgi:hypothetical protein
MERGKTMKKYFLALLLLMAATPVYAASSCLPYIGETLHFSVGWEFVNAGTATLTYSSMGENGYRAHTLAKTNKFLDIFKKVRDTIVSEGVCLDGKIQSTRFDLNQHENRYKSNKKTEFLWKENRVKYTHNNNTTFYDVPAGHLNVMDAFTRVRMLDLKPGAEIHVPVFDQKKTYHVVVNVSKKKAVLKMPSGEKVECLIIEPKLKTAGVFSSKGKIKIWMTNDSRHIPLKMTAKIKIGRIMARLTGYVPAS